MTDHLRSKLTERGYKPSITKTNIDRVKFSERAMKLNPNKDESSSHPLVFATKYCNQIGEIRIIINKFWERIQEIPNLKDTFPDKPRIAYKSNQSLRNQLVRAKLPVLLNTEPSTTPNMDSAPVPPKETQEPPVPITSLDLPRATRSNSNVPFYSGKQPPTFAQQRVFPFTVFKQAKAIKPCFKAKCKTCGKLTHNSNFVKSKVNQRCYPVRPCSKPMTCQSNRIVYLIQCNKCLKQYVGQTTKPLHIRMNQHVSSYYQ